MEVTVKKLISFILALFIITASLSVFSFADFGDFGGDADFGDFGGGDWGNDDYDYDDDDGGLFFLPFFFGSGGSGLGKAVIIIVIIVFIVLRIVTKSKAGSKSSPSRVNVGDRSTPQSSLRPMAEYRSLDPDFNEAELRETVSNLYVRMQNAWSAGDISDLRPYFTDALFTQFERQLAQKRAQGLTNRMDRISVQSVVLRGFTQSGGCDHIIAQLQTRLVDYTVDKTGKVVSGSPDREKFMTYEWDLSRTSGMISLKKDGVSRIFCPSCGAPLDVNASARCEYCGSVIRSSEHDFAICNITAISQITT